MKKIVTKEILDLYHKYDGEFGLLYERWTLNKDREMITSEQEQILEEYVDLLYSIKVESLSEVLKTDN